MTAADNGGHETSYFSRGDPTERTSKQLFREVEVLRDLLRTEIAALKNTHDVKFEEVALRFELFERGRVEQKQDAEARIAAALTAQKEAVKEQTTASERAIAKSEAATTKQIDQQVISASAAIGGVTSSLTDLKERISKIESYGRGSTAERVEQRASNGAFLALGGFGISIVLAVVTILAFAIQR